MDIDGWLSRIGLAQYAEIFRANDVDGELLGRLTNDDLKDIGVASFGHRKKLLEAIAELGGAPSATTALALAGETGEHWTDALLHRMRGEILLKRDPANTAPAEEAFLTAIAIAREQKAKSFELRAALSLAKPFQSTGRAADAHAVLAPALEGFSPTPEFPEIAEAQRLLGSLGSQRDQGYAGL